MTAQDHLSTKLNAALTKRGISPFRGLVRLHGGAMMESWFFEASEDPFILRRAPSAEIMSGRPFGHDVEAALIRAAREAGITAPEIAFDLADNDDLGSGFVMRALPGTTDPNTILACQEPDRLLAQCAQQLARIHSLPAASIPDAVPVLDYHQALEDLHRQFAEAGADRPIIALGLRWLRDHLPAPIEPRLNHGDFRVGKLLVEGSRLTGVLDWEVAHWGDPHEDLAYACMTVWRFERIDRPALGLGSLTDWISAYEAFGGAPVNRDRLHYWLVYRTVWWGLGCIGMAQTWRSSDPSLERLVISRRASEQELDLLLLLESDAPDAEQARTIAPTHATADPAGEATASEIAVAVRDWLATLKDRVEKQDRFQLAVARNALGMISREDHYDGGAWRDPELSRAILNGEQSLSTPGLLGRLRRTALDKLAADVPRYPALAVARAKWTGEA